MLIREPVRWSWWEKSWLEMLSNSDFSILRGRTNRPCRTNSLSHRSAKQLGAILGGFSYSRRVVVTFKITHWNAFRCVRLYRVISVFVTSLGQAGNKDYKSVWMFNVGQRRKRNREPWLEVERSAFYVEFSDGGRHEKSNTRSASQFYPCRGLRLCHSALPELSARRLLFARKKCVCVCRIERTSWLVAVHR